VIDFYATNRKEKLAWVKVLEETIGKIPKVLPWAQFVLDREKQQRMQKETAIVKGAI